MKTRLRQYAVKWLFVAGLSCLFAVAPVATFSAPYAAVVMDARSGEVLHSRNADARLHPASLTKMMTLYVTFEAIRRGEISLDKTVTISKKAAAEPPSKLGLKAGQRIKMRYLIRAAAVKSANDAATALAEAVSGSEAAFARRMNRTAKALGMTRTTFKNAHGLTEAGHLSTARDMTILGRRLFYDHPEYYNLFSRRSTNAGVREVSNTNRKLLGSYRGADGIKTGYTRAAGFNLVASAERGKERVIATVFGGRSSASRNAQVAKLLDMGFSRAPSNVATRKPALPAYAEEPRGDGKTLRIGKTIRVDGAVKKSPRPKHRPITKPGAPPEALLLALRDQIEDAVSEVATANAAVEPEQSLPTKTAPTGSEPEAPAVVAETPVAPDVDEDESNVIVASVEAPKPRPFVKKEPAPRQVKVVLANVPAAPAQPRRIDADKPVREVVTRLSTSGGRHWGVNVGRFTTRHKAERILLKTALTEMTTLDGALRKVGKSSQGWEANFVGMTQEMSELACRRLEARGMACKTIGPG